MMTAQGVSDRDGRASKAKLFLAVFSVVSIVFAEISGAVQLSGRVVERGTKEKVGRALVVLLPEKIRTETDEQGRFTLKDIPLGAHTLVINRPGYQKSEISFDVDAQTLNTDKTFYLSPTQVVAEFETQVLSKERKESGSERITMKRAKTLPGSGFDPIRAVQNLPGVNRPPGFSSQVIIQGSAPQDTRYQIDGHEIPIVFHFGGLSSVLEPEFVSEINLLTAGYSANRGRAIGGILDLETKDIKTDRAKGHGYLDIFNVGGRFETEVGEKSYIAASARTSFIGPVLRAATKGNDNVSLTAVPSFSDTSIIYQTELNDRLKFKLVTLGSYDTLELLSESGLGDDPALRGSFSNSTAFYRLIPQFTYTHDNRSVSRFSLGLGQDFTRFEFNDQFFSLRSNALTTRADHEITWSDTFKTTLGFDHRYAWSDVSFVLPQIFNSGGVTNPISSGGTRRAGLEGFETHQLGFFVQNRYKPSLDSPWILSPELRADYFKAIRDWRLSPRFNARYSASPSLDFVGATGLFIQQPREQEFSPEYGNRNLKPPRAIHAKLGMEKDLSAELEKGSRVQSNVFGRWFSDLVIANPTTFYSNEGKGRAVGWESLFETRLDQWSLFLSYTLSRSTRWDPSQPEYLFQFDQTHLLTLIGSVRLPREWTLASRVRYVTGNRASIPVDSVFDADNDVYIPIRGQAFNARLNPFFSVDFRADKRWIYDEWILSLYIDIQNLFNIQNPEQLQFSYDYRSNQVVTGLPIIPTFGIKGEF